MGYKPGNRNPFQHGAVCGGLLKDLGEWNLAQELFDSQVLQTFLQDLLQSPFRGATTSVLRHAAETVTFEHLCKFKFLKVGPKRW